MALNEGCSSGKANALNRALIQDDVAVRIRVDKVKLALAVALNVRPHPMLMNLNLAHFGVRVARAGVLFARHIKRHLDIFFAPIVMRREALDQLRIETLLNQFLRPWKQPDHDVSRL